jgi:sugar phosphate isomerase/epimerase
MEKQSRRSFMKHSSVFTAAALVNPGWVQAAPHATEQKIVAFSKHLHFLEYPELAAVLKDTGFDGADLTVRPDGHVLPENVERDLPKVVKTLSDHNLEVVMMSTAIRSVKEPHTEKILKTAGQLKIPFYRLNWLKYDPALSIKQNLQEFRQQLEQLAEMNEKYNIKAAYQNHAGDSFGSPVWDLAAILEELKTPWVGSQYDIRHATVEGVNSWPLGLKKISPYINTIDIKDFIWENNVGKSQVKNVPLGEGVVEFSRFFPLLKELKVSAPLSIHFEYDLGGAQHGRRQIQMEPEKIYQYMQEDLKTLKSYLA